MKVYLTGPLNLGAEHFQQMAEARYRLPKTVEVTSPLDSIDTDQQDGESMKTYLSKRIKLMLEADAIVTMDHCDIDPVSKSEVSLARTADMQVIPYWKFLADHGNS